MNERFYVKKIRGADGLCAEFRNNNKMYRYTFYTINKTDVNGWVHEITEFSIEKCLVERFNYNSPKINITILINDMTAKARMRISHIMTSCHTNSYHSFSRYFAGKFVSPEEFINLHFKGGQMQVEEKNQDPYQEFLNRILSK